MDKIRLLVLYQGKTLEDHAGYHDGFQHLLSEGILSEYKAIPYYGYAEKHGWDDLWEEAITIVKKHQMDVVFLQFFHGPIPDPTKRILQLKQCPSNPTIFTSLGDPFGIYIKPVPKSYRIASRLADINFLTGMGKLATGLARNGSKNLVLMPHGCCQVRFSSQMTISEYNPQFDVVFIGNRMRSRYCIGSSSYYGFWRDLLVKKLTKRYGKKFGLWGKGWTGHPSWQGSIPYDRQHESIRKGRIQIGGYPNSLNDYYTSDRVFIALASGIPFVDYRVPGVECIFKDEQDWWLGDTLDEMVKKVDELLEKPQDELLAIGAKVREVILGNHTQYNRCQQMVMIAKEYRRERQNTGYASKPELPFLKYSSSIKVGSPIINWQG